MKMMTGLASVALLGCLAVGASAQDAKVEIKPLVTKLKNPCGVTIEPETGHVYIADSAAKRVLRYEPKTEGSEAKIDVAINQFPQDVYGKGPMFDIGPLGLAFLKKGLLVVGGGGLPDGEELLRVYELPADGSKITAEQMKHKLGPIGPGEKTAKGEGNFYELAVTPTAIYATANGDDTKGWVARAEVKDNEPSNFDAWLATKEATGVDAPVGIEISPDGKLVVGQMGEINIPGDSLLTVYDPETKELELQADAGLFDICALAYSPKSKKLYALDFAWMDTSKGGLFRLDVTGEGDDVEVEAVKLAPLDKPTAMIFDDEGALYVTEIGTAEEGDANAKPGRLLKITGDL